MHDVLSWHIIEQKEIMTLNCILFKFQRPLNHSISGSHNRPQPTKCYDIYHISTEGKSPTGYLVPVGNNPEGSQVQNLCLF